MRLRVYRLPTDTVRLDSASVHHDPADLLSLFQLGVSKDHRPDLNQFKVMLATLDPVGLPGACQTVAGNADDDTLYVPADDAAVRVLDRTAVLVVGDSKLGALRWPRGGTSSRTVARTWVPTGPQPQPARLPPDYERPPATTAVTPHRNVEGAPGNGP